MNVRRLRQGYNDGLKDADKRYSFDKDYQDGYRIGMKIIALKTGKGKLVNGVWKKFLYFDDGSWHNSYFFDKLSYE